MKKLLTLTVALLITSLTANAQTSLGTDTKTGLPKVYDESLNQMEQIDLALSKTKAEGKFLICQIGGNWCPWCLKFADYISKDEDIAKIVNDNFVYIHVNYKPSDFKNNPGIKEVTLAMMKRLGNPGRFGYPVFVVLDTDGKVIHIQDSSFLEEGDGYNKDKVLRFFKNWTPKAVNK